MTLRVASSENVAHELIVAASCSHAPAGLRTWLAGSASMPNSAFSRLCLLAIRGIFR